MSNLIPGNQKHLTLNDRIYIEDSLNEGMSFKNIAKYLCKDPTTISKEVKLHRLTEWHHENIFYNAKNHCVHRYRCQKTNACHKIELCGIRCASCPTCNSTCPDFQREHCSHLAKAPYVCNGCKRRNGAHCTIDQRYVYNARFADRKYHETLSGCRAGITTTKHQLIEMDKIVSPLINQGQSPYVIVTDHPELGKSVRTIYTYLDMGLFSARNVDLKRKVKFKARKCHKSQITERTV